MARAHILLGQHRYDLAEPELRQALALAPDDAEAHAMLATCLRELERFTDATAEASVAVGLAPDDAETHYVLSTVASARNQPIEAMAAIKEAIRLDPGDPRYWGQMAFLHHAKAHHRDALEAAERGLQLDPENAICTNVRAMALRGLGRKDDAGDAVAAALARNPESAISHANMGWNMLHQSKPKQAMEHFREALRLQPDLEWARAGIVEALKARWLPYRLILRYFLFMSRLTKQTQWFIMIGGVVGCNIANQTAKSSPTLAPYLWPLVGLYLAFAISTWVAVPIFNLMLLVSRFGRMVLNRHEKIGAGAFGVSLLPPLGAAIMWWNTGSDLWKFAAMVLLPQVVGFAMTAHGRAGRGLTIRWCWAGLVALATVLVLLGGYFMPKKLWALEDLGITVLILMGVGSVWVSNIAGSMREKVRK